MEAVPFEDFNEFDWNDHRIELEEDVVEAVSRLSDFMGCNSFTLPMGLMRVKVHIVSEQLDALSD